MNATDTAESRLYGFFYRTDPATDSVQPWLYEVVEYDDAPRDLEPELARELEVNVLGQLLDVGAPGTA